MVRNTNGFTKIFCGEVTVHQINGQLSRLDGPAWHDLGNDHRCSYDEWCLDGKTHRIDGPARMWGDGYKEWWIHGEHIGKNKSGPLSGFQLFF